MITNMILIQAFLWLWRPVCLSIANASGLASMSQCSVLRAQWFSEGAGCNLYSVFQASMCAV